MFLFNWIYSKLYYLGFYQKNAKLTFIGPDDSGKTSLLHVLKDKGMIQLDANKYPLPEECVIENIRYRIFDLPGFERLNKIVHDYLIYSDAIIFIVDSADRKSFHIAKEVLNELLLSEEYKSIPFLILGNKIMRYSELS